MPVSASLRLPSSLVARMAAILFAGLLSAQLASLWFQWDERAMVVTQARGLNFADRLVDAVRQLEASPPTERPSVIASLRAEQLDVQTLTASEVATQTPRGGISDTLTARLGSPREIRSAGGMGAGMGPGRGIASHGGQATHTARDFRRSFDVRLSDGQWVRIAETDETNAAPAFSQALIAQLLLTLFIASVVVMIAVRQATLPLKKLAQAADALGSDLAAPPLPETGPAETRQAAQAFNRMQSRIRRLVDERARALAAVSHDLRTPLTRLRLRAELVDDETLRDQMAADLEAMATMIDATLDYLRGLHDSEALRPIDMNALLQSLADDSAVLGRQVSISGDALAPYNGRLSALRRALQNLIDNAIHYGHGARLVVDDNPAELYITVEDDGPGIPPAELARVTEPFYRPDASRSRETGGVGLGLSIVSDIALLHGGELQLANRPTGGLRATLRLPRRPPAVRRR